MEATTTSFDTKSDVNNSKEKGISDFFLCETEQFFFFFDGTQKCLLPKKV